MNSEKETESAQSSADIDTPPSPIDIRPDGGLEAWMVVAGAWGACFCSWGWINSVGVFQEYYGKNILKEYTPGTVSWILCLEAFFLLALAPVIGKLFDRYGPPLNCVVGYFDTRRSTAFGIVATGSSFPWAMRATALLLLVVLTMTNLTVKSRIPLNPSPFSVKEYILPFKRTAFLLTSFGNILFAFGSFVPMTYLVVQAVSMGMDRRLAQYLVAIINGSSTAGRLGAGVLADVYGPFNAWIAVTYAAGILILSLWIPTTNDASIIAFASLFGICFGAYVAIQPALVAQITPIADIGICTGLYFSLSAFSQLVSGPIAGHTLETSGGSYLEMKIMAGFLCLAGATFVLGAKLYATGYKLMAKF
ncbi:hypothetical protein VE01_07211 [Pseudogymnoascus verrucosus]|uniref:Major facilitator superfamily (MFS) profile domain-containing protein n=1 Tax=Pseudogymnoascus verrucosus TaxID=342668 RepID=A0A1B8GF32_9PEZI|nr:uncharacterized protein VE01_07211 [Pseudogymnoascus verrucosus]OBT94427.1 hypothetical protein VE01_07211 [Pseudogymnoascus verrucosus]